MKDILRHVPHSLHYLLMYVSTTCVSGGYEKIADCEAECLDSVFLLSSHYCHFNKEISLVKCVWVHLYCLKYWKHTHLLYFNRVCLNYLRLETFREYIALQCQKFKCHPHLLERSHLLAWKLPIIIIFMTFLGNTLNRRNSCPLASLVLIQGVACFLTSFLLA